jgi:hypothetical protein
MTTVPFAVALFATLYEPAEPKRRDRRKLQPAAAARG